MKDFPLYFLWNSLDSYIGIFCHAICRHSFYNFKMEPEDIFEWDSNSGAEYLILDMQLWNSRSTPLHTVKQTKTVKAGKNVDLSSSSCNSILSNSSKKRQIRVVCAESYPPSLITVQVCGERKRDYQYFWDWSAHFYTEKRWARESCNWEEDSRVLTMMSSVRWRHCPMPNWDRLHQSQLQTRAQQLEDSFSIQKYFGSFALSKK